MFLFFSSAFRFIGRGLTRAVDVVIEAWTLFCVHIIREKNERWSDALPRCGAAVGVKVLDDPRVLLSTTGPALRP